MSKSSSPSGRKPRASSSAPPSESPTPVASSGPRKTPWDASVLDRTLTLIENLQKQVLEMSRLMLKLTTQLEEAWSRLATLELAWSQRFGTLAPRNCPKCGARILAGPSSACPRGCKST